MPQNRRFIALFFTLEPNEQSPMGDSLHNFTPPIFEKSAMFLPGGLQVWHMTDKQQSWGLSWFFTGLQYIVLQLQ